MGRKIFVSYKYNDCDVRSLRNDLYITRACDYVDYIKSRVLSCDDIYKGEKSNEDLSCYSDEYIKQHLKDKIYDSSVTILLISPNMKEPHRWQKTQWIPWEISYSLRETTRNDRTSHRNSILAVVLPDSNGNYGYYTWARYLKTLFPILSDNIDNGYIYVVEWDNFVYNPYYYISKADECKRNTSDRKLVIDLNL